MHCLSQQIYIWFIVYSDILRNMFFCERFVLNNDYNSRNQVVHYISKYFATEAITQNIAGNLYCSSNEYWE